MSAIDSAREALCRIAGVVAELDLVDADTAKGKLDAALPLAALGDVRALVEQAHAEGSLTPNKAGPISFWTRSTRQSAPRAPC